MKIVRWVILSSWLLERQVKFLNKGQSSKQMSCIKILVANKNIELSTTSQLDDESVIQILEVCLKQLREKASQEAVPIGKEK